MRVVGPLAALVLWVSGAGLGAEPVSSQPLRTSAGTVRVRGTDTFSFVLTERNSGGRTHRLARLCWPRGSEYRLTVESDLEHHIFDLSFCPGKNPERVSEGECLRLIRVPEVVPSSRGGKAAEPLPSAWGTSVLSYRGRQLELFIEDGLSPTVQAWLADEWRDVDPELKTALAECLSLAVRAPIGLGSGVSLALMAFPREEIRRFDANEITIDRSSTSLCSASPGVIAPAAQTR